MISMPGATKVRVTLRAATSFDVPVRASGDATGTSLGASMLFGAGQGYATGGEAAEPLDVAGFDAYVARWREAIA